LQSISTTLILPPLMLGCPTLILSPFLAQAAAPLLAPVLILVLCVVAGIGTLLLLPGRREASFRRIGGVVLIAAGLIFFAALPSAFSSAMGIYFWIFAAVAILGSLRVVTHPRPVYSALYFVLTIFASAGLFILLEAEFMAAALVLIYAGAILVTYVFVIMLASQASNETTPTPAQQLAEYDNVSREPLAAVAIGFGLMGVLLFVIFDKAASLAAPAGRLQLTGLDGQPSIIVPVQGVTQELGMFLFRSQLVQLELAGLILSVAMVGAIVIARRQVIVNDPVLIGPDVVIGPSTPIDDNPHSIPVYGTENPRQKAYPQT
jgi:NADH-quinone oxidoreductase subunit J